MGMLLRQPWEQLISQECWLRPNARKILTRMLSLIARRRGKKYYSAHDPTEFFMRGTKAPFM